VIPPDFIIDKEVDIFGAIASVQPFSNVDTGKPAGTSIAINQSEHVVHLRSQHDVSGETPILHQIGASNG
jgi:hypothetical protein